MIEKLKTPKNINWDDTPENLIQRHLLITDAYEKINELVDAINPILQERESQIKVYEETMEMVRQNSQPKTTYNVATGEMEAPTKTKCPLCNGTLAYDEGVDEWYCDKCWQYADKNVWCALINAINKK